MGVDVGFDVFGRFNESIGWKLWRHRTVLSVTGEGRGCDCEDNESAIININGLKPKVIPR